jgi:hypothetical protein
MMKMICDLDPMTMISSLELVASTLSLLPEALVSDYSMKPSQLDNVDV